MASFNGPFNASAPAFAATSMQTSANNSRAAEGIQRREERVDIYCQRMPEKKGGALSTNDSYDIWHPYVRTDVNQWVYRVWVGL